MYDLFSLCPDDIAPMADRAVMEAMTVAREAVCRAEAVQVRSIARLAQIRGHTRWVADEIAIELSLSRQAANNLVDVCLTLTTRLPAVLAAMDRGEVNLWTARKICDVTGTLSDELCRRVDERIAGRIVGKDPEQARRIARNAVHTLDPDGCAERAKKRREDRKVELIHSDEGMASLWAYLPAEVASGIYARVDGIARKLKTKDEQRTLDQLRADVLADLLLGKHEGLPGVLAHVYVHVPLDAALGITATGCELTGHGPIPGEIARQIMHDPGSVWRKVTCDPTTGAVLDVGRTRYRPPAALDDLVRIRDRECRVPGCRRPAHHCDADHNREFGRGQYGRTSPTNLTCLCRYHHRLKDVDGWDFDLDEQTGTLSITTPTGGTHTSRPEPILRPAVGKTDESTKDDHNDSEPPF